MFESSHKLDFLSCHWDNPFNIDGWQAFKVGTVHGTWNSTENSYDILAIINDEPGNGHLNDVLEWFENSCKRDGKSLRILALWNKKFAHHLVTKRSFAYEQDDNVIKRFST